MVLAPALAGAQGVAVKTNLLHDAAAVPSLGVEVPFAHRWSASLDWDYINVRNYSHDRHWRIEGGDLAMRWWPRGWDREVQPLTGHHLGVYAQAYTFQIQLNDRFGYMSGGPDENLTGHPGWGAGLEYGYSWHITDRLNLDISLGVGIFHTRYQQYRRRSSSEYCGSCDGCDTRYVKVRSGVYNWIGPTKGEISMVWYIGPHRHGGKADGEEVTL